MKRKSVMIRPKMHRKARILKSDPGPFDRMFSTRKIGGSLLVIVTRIKTTDLLLILRRKLAKSRADIPTLTDL
jgi:hypothetical protein